MTGDGELDGDELAAIEEALLVAGPTDEERKTVSSLAINLRQLDRQIVQATVNLKELMNRRRELGEVVLPELMQTTGQRSFTLWDGDKVELAETFHLSLPVKDEVKRAKALKWLLDNKHSGIVKSKLEVELPRGKPDVWTKALEVLKAMGLKATTQETVHPSTLGKWGREMHKDGKTPPADLFGSYVQQSVTIKGSNNED